MIERIDIKTPFLSCDEALAKLEMEINVLKFNDENMALKVIHGYGSSGKGGAIKKALHEFLPTLVKQNKIDAFLPNEKFCGKNPIYLKYTALFPELILDSDLMNLNPGITLIFFK